MADPFIIETDALTKRYGAVEALRGLTMQVPAGSICGFLGRNGAGKTTAIKLLMRMALPTSGRVRVMGLPADDPVASVGIRQRTGFVSDDKDLYAHMTVAEMIRFTSAFFPRWRTDLETRYLRAFELPAERKVKELSRGMRSQLALLLALCRRAELLVLDEPTSGLDPAATEAILQLLIRHVGEDETTVFFSSHQIAEVDQIADRVVIIDSGRAVVSGALDELRENFRRVRIVFDGDAPDVPLRSPGVARVWRSGRVITVLSSAGAESLVAEAQGLRPVSVDVVPVSLKEIFLEAALRED
jgi:ABC-2 type transport system ATP-binding protein